MADVSETVSKVWFALASLELFDKRPACCSGVCRATDMELGTVGTEGGTEGEGGHTVGARLTAGGVPSSSTDAGPAAANVPGAHLTAAMEPAPSVHTFKLTEVRPVHALLSDPRHC